MPVNFLRRSSGPTELKRKQDRKFAVRLTVHDLQGLSLAQDDGSDEGLSIEIKWKGPGGGNGLFSKKSMYKGRTSWQAENDTVTWDDEFQQECLLLASSKMSGQQGNSSFQPWDVRFVIHRAPRANVDKFVQVGWAALDLASFASISQFVRKTEVFPVSLQSNAEVQPLLKVTVQMSDITDDAEQLEGAQPVRAYSEGLSSDFAMNFGSSLPWIPKKEKAGTSDEEEDDESPEETKGRVSGDKGVKKGVSMSRLTFVGLRGRSKGLQREGSNEERLIDALDLPMAYGGEETEDEDMSKDDSLRYGRIVGVNLALHNNLPAVPPLLPLSGADLEEAVMVSPRSDPASPSRRSAENSGSDEEVRAPATGIASPASSKQGQSGRKFLGLSFGSSLKLPMPTDGAAAASPSDEANDDSDTEDAPEASRASAAGLQIRVPGTSFSDWGVAVWGGKRKMASRSPKVMEEPLLNKSYGEEGGDEIDWDRRQAEEAELGHPLHQQKFSRKEKSEFNEETLNSVFGDAFFVGRWETREITNRDGTAKLRTDMFFASLDQCHEKAAGGGACTSLVAMVAEWLHAHPFAMPNKAEFDDIIKEGSAEWRRLCEIEAYKARFADKHFDLDTVVEARNGSLQLLPERSYVGFFCPASGAEKLSFLEGAMSFDNIFKEVEAAGPGVYILSWNDHFFVLVVEREKCFIIDTLGERLYEGCRQAYILRFDSTSTITNIEPPPAPACAQGSKNAAGQSVPNHGKQDASKVNAETPADSGPSKEAHQVAFLQGALKGSEETAKDVGAVTEKKSAIGLCGQFVKEFFAAVPLRELENDLAKGLIGELPVHQRLQVEFHYTLPGNKGSK